MRVLAALSGGVDSAVAAAKAVEAGHEVVGVHMALSSQPQECRLGSRGCCSVEDAADAARAAEIMGIPFYVWDLAEEFEQTVITDFVEQYAAGHTPNPCVRCNEFVKFRELAQRARALGFDAVCTGHYARILTISVLFPMEIPKASSSLIWAQSPEKSSIPMGKLLAATKGTGISRLVSVVA